MIINRIQYKSRSVGEIKNFPGASKNLKNKFMAIFIKMEQRKNSKNSSYGKYYTKTVPMGEVTSEDIAKSLEKHAVFRAGLVEDVLYEFTSAS